MNRELQYAALLLLQAARDIMTERRKTEMMCGYPSDYGGDEVLLEKIAKFLDLDHYMRQEVIEARDYLKKAGRKP